MIPTFETTHWVYPEKEKPEERVIQREYRYWDVNLDRGSEKALANFMKALVYCAGKLHDAYLMYDPNSGFGGWSWGNQSVFTRVSLPEGMEERFTNISGVELRKPPVVHLN